MWWKETSVHWFVGSHVSLPSLISPPISAAAGIALHNSSQEKCTISILLLLLEMSPFGISFVWNFVKNQPQRHFFTTPPCGKSLNYFNRNLGKKNTKLVSKSAKTVFKTFKLWKSRKLKNFFQTGNTLAHKLSMLWFIKISIQRTCSKWELLKVSPALTINNWKLV